MTPEPSPLVDQCLRRMLVERGGSPVPLQVNASLAHRRRGAQGDPLVEAELELVVALATEPERASLVGRVRAIAERWSERDPARAAALDAAAERLATGAGGPPAPVRIEATPPVVHAAAAPVVSLRPRGPLVALAAVLLLGLAGGGVWLVTRGGKQESTVAAASFHERKEDRWPSRGEARKEEEPPVGATRNFDHGAAAPAYGAAAPAFEVPAPAAPAPDMPATDATADALFGAHRDALARAAWDEVGRTLADGVFHWGPDAANVMTGRDAMLSDLRALAPGDPTAPGTSLAIAASWGGAHEDLAWSYDDLSWQRERPGKKPAVSRFLVSRVAMRRGDRWEIVASTWARRTSDSRLAAASAAGVAPALAALPETADVAPSPVGALHQALASRDALEAFVAPGDLVHALGSDAERDEGARAVARRYKKLGGKVYPLGGARFEVGADGLSAWLATNVEVVSASKASGDVVMPYRLLAVLAHDPGMGTWKAVMMHWSAGGPVPRVKSPKGAPAAESDGDEPVADPSMVAAEATPLTGAELRAAFGAAREAVEACRAVVDGDAAQDGGGDAAPPRVLVKVVASVTAEGAVDSVDVEGAWAGTAHAACVEEVVAGLTFRPPGAAQTVRYPFAL